MSELISIVVPTYNRGQVIAQCIQNLKEQTYSDLEIIVVDDGSTDNTADIMETLTDSVVHYYRMEKNQGACAARNRGVELAAGNYIAFQDSDDLWKNDKLEKQMKYLLENKLDVVFCSMERLKEGEKPYVIPERKMESHMLMKELYKCNFISTQTLLGKKECFQQEPFDLKLPRLQDYDLMLRIVPRYKVGHLPEILVEQRVGQDSISTSPQKLKAAIIRLSEKYKNLDGFNYSLFMETGYRNYFAGYGFNSKALFRRAWGEKKTVKAFLLCLIPDFILRPYVRKMHGK